MLVRGVGRDAMVQAVIEPRAAVDRNSLPARGMAADGVNEFWFPGHCLILARPATLADVRSACWRVGFRWMNLHGETATCGLVFAQVEARVVPPDQGRFAMKMGMKAAVWVVLASPAALVAQMQGVSHPEQIPVTTSPEGIGQPIVYETPAVAAPAKELKSRPVLTATVAEPRNMPQEESAAAARERAMTTLPANSDGLIVERVAGPANAMPVGAMMKVRMLESLSSKKTTAGAEFSAELSEPMERDGRVLLPAGTLVRGRVTDVHAGKRVSGQASMHLLPNSVVLPDGTVYPLRAQVIDTSLYRSESVDSEGTIVKSDHAKGTVAAIGLATGSGAAVGGVLGGWPGALVGAGVSAGISTVVWLRQDHQTEVPAGTSLTLQLTQPLEVGAR